MFPHAGSPRWPTLGDIKVAVGWVAVGWAALACCGAGQRPSLVDLESPTNCSGVWFQGFWSPAGAGAPYCELAGWRADWVKFAEDGAGRIGRDASTGGKEAGVVIAHCTRTLNGPFINRRMHADQRRSGLDFSAPLRLSAVDPSLPLKGRAHGEFLCQPRRRWYGCIVGKYLNRVKGVFADFLALTPLRLADKTWTVKELIERAAA
jgi:hypothetical protein